MCQCLETLLVCPCLLTSKTSLQLQRLLSLNFGLPDWGCGLSMDATYTWKFYFMYGIPLTHTSVIKTYRDIHIITNVSISQQGT